MSSSEDPPVEMNVTPPQIRAAYNPFEHGCWMDYANRVTQGYMEEERDDWSPLGDHHGVWLDLFDGDQNFCMLCHRDGLKTTVTLVYLTACLEYLDGFRAHWITNTQGQAHKKAHTELNKFIDRNPWLVNLNNKRTDNKEEKEFGNGSMLYAGWLFGGIEGDRSHLLILDDVIKERGDGDTENILTWIQGVTVPMTKEGGKSVVIGTRKRPNDIYNHFRTQSGYNFVEYPAILDVWDQEFREDDDWRSRRPDPSLYTEVQNPFDNGDSTISVLWPEARGPSWLREKYSEMSPHLFWREYCMVIRGASGNLVDEQDINKLAREGGCSIRNKSPPNHYTPSAGEKIVVGHDPAQSPTGDKAAFVVQLVLPDNTRRILHAYAAQGMPPSQIRAKLLDLNDRYDPGQIVIESNGMQQYVVNDAIEMTPEMQSKTIGMATSGKKHSWENGIPRLRTLIENGKLQFYRGDDGIEDLVQAALSLELSDGKLKGHTPDLIAAWYMAEKGSKNIQNQSSDRGVRSF